jgi:hypothetical protein
MLRSCAVNAENESVFRAWFPKELCSRAAVRYSRWHKVLSQEALRQSRIAMCKKRLPHPQLKNVVFLERVGETLRQVTKPVLPRLNEFIVELTIGFTAF